jgi:membrane fusion protein (multidrug efflux system)
MSKRMVLILALTLLVFGGLLGAKWFGNRMMNQFFDNMPVPPVAISAAEAQADRWISEVTAVGSVAAVQGASLTTEAAGIVETIHFENGAEVNAGDVIVTLDTATDRAQLRSLQAAARLAELERDRLKTLYARKSISKSEFDQRQSLLEQAEANVAAQEARIEEKTLRAPYAGRLGIRQVNIGQYVAAGDPIIGLQSLDPVFLNFTLPEQRFADISVGGKVRAAMDALRGQTFEGRITAIEPVIDADTRNFRVQATLANPEQQLRPGMFARVSLNVGEERDVVTVPRTAISFNPYGNAVFVLVEGEEKGEDGKPQLVARQRFVRTGEERGDLIAIEEGLAVGDRVASSGLLKLRSGAAVTIDNEVVPDANIAPTPDNG